MVKKIHKAVLDDRRLKVRELADTVGISKSAVHRILSENLDMRKLCARWVPRLLTLEQKQCRDDVSIECLAKFHSKKPEFLSRFITMDDTWVHHFTPETKEQLKQWTQKGEPAPRKAQTVSCAGRVMASVFWDARGIILSEEIKQKRPHLVKKKVLFQDNASKTMHQLTNPLLQWPKLMN